MSPYSPFPALPYPTNAFAFLPVCHAIPCQLNADVQCYPQAYSRFVPIPSTFLFRYQRHPYNCTSLSNNITSSPGLNAGNPIYGHPSHLNASPRLQFPQLPTFPGTVKSTSAKSSDCNLRVLRAASALERLAASSASRRWARPQVQSLQARRRLALGLHSVAVGGYELVCYDHREMGFV